MKYKIGDKVKILRVGHITDPKVNDWIGQTSKVSSAINDIYFPYRLENGFVGKEDELELVPEFKVGDRVRVTPTASPDYTRGKVGSIHSIVGEGTGYPFKVRLDHYDAGWGEKVGDSGWDFGYSAEELEPWEDTLTLKHLKDAYELIGGAQEMAYFITPWWADLKPEAKPKATRQQRLLGRDGIWYTAEFVDISFEMFRSYTFPKELIPDGRMKQAHTVRIDNPRWLWVAPSGSHRIIDKYGRSHYIPSGFLHLKWMVKGGVEKSGRVV